MSQDEVNPLQEMLDAYNKATGNSLKMSKLRKWCLRAIRERGFDATDVAAVMVELKRRTITRPQSYDTTSLEFGTALGNTDKFEDRALTLRNVAKKRGKKPASRTPAPAVPAPSEDEAARIREQVKLQAAELRAKLTGKGKP